MRGDIYQITLVGLGVVVTGLFGVFLYREVYPEYQIYQKDYVALEQFRSTYSGEMPPPFKIGIKQLVYEDKNKGPEEVDRCISCHVALEFQHFSPTKISYDINGNIQLDADGFPVKVPNEEYVWTKLEAKIQDLKEHDPNDKRIGEYSALFTAKVDDKTYNVKKVLAMHPLIGRETRPFAFHPMEEYSCTSCHNGNGRGLTTEKAHGPVFDGQYEEEFVGPVPHFLEKDTLHDPQFAYVFNHKPGHSLLFQTTPLFVGGLIEAKCVQCHKTTSANLLSAYNIANLSIKQSKAKHDAVIQSLDLGEKALIDLIKIRNNLEGNGFVATYTALERREANYMLPQKEREDAIQQLAFLRRNRENQDQIPSRIDEKILKMVGSKELMDSLYANPPKNQGELTDFLAKSITPQSQGTLFDKYRAANLEDQLIQHVENTEQSLQATVADQAALSSMVSDIDLLTKTYQKGRALFLSQACYACHRISGLSHGGVGPELTEEGKKYPWFVKESIVWPQADLKTSTMPNYRLDHEELEALTTFLLAQKGRPKSDSEVAYKVALQEWERGQRLNPWEKPITPLQMENIDYAMEVFATEGCASCHRLKGFTSTVGFAAEKNQQATFEQLYREKQWFHTLFPEDLLGSEIIKALENHRDEIDQHLVEGVRENAILEKIEEKYPQTIEALYSNFKFAARAKNDKPSEEQRLWKELLHRVLMAYVQEYGLGRLIGPRPNWSGIYRSDEWLMEHFANPSSHVARSIMPVFPFTTNKFYALTRMLDRLAIKNRDEVRAIWDHFGFDPEDAYEIHCSQCHGAYLQGNGPVSEWIYPIPKSLRNADFLRNLTREKAYESIYHGVKGTPMPPWGEVATGKNVGNQEPVLKKDEIKQLIDWIYSNIPGGTVIKSIKDVPKWNYHPENAIEEMHKEGEILKAAPKGEEEGDLSFLAPKEIYYADLHPKVYKEDNQVQTYFDVVDNPIKGTEKNNYYIKKKFYTKENIDAGETFFALNCSVCHGREADGSGNRAGAMVNAKPRMLTNLDWLDTRDDLRLLRSIKYGVPGTAMVAWGDQTSSKQRMQLVIYIRNLSAEAKLREILFEKLYQAYGVSELKIEELRGQEFPKIAEIEKKIDSIQGELRNLDRAAKNQNGDIKLAADAYEKELTLSQELSQAKQGDDLLESLVEEIKREKALMTELGIALIAQRNEGVDVYQFFEILNLEANRFNADNEEDIKKYKAIILNQISQKIAALKALNEIDKGKISTPEVRTEIQEREQKIKNLESASDKLIYAIEESKRSNIKQKSILEKFFASKV